MSDSGSVHVEESVRALAWCDAVTCAVGDASGAVHLWHTGLEQMEWWDTSPVPADSCTALAAHPTLPWLAAGWERGRVRIDRAGTRTSLDLREPVDALAFAPGTSGLLAVAAGHDVVVVDNDGELVVAEWYRRGAAVCLCWIDETVLAIGGNGGVSFLSVVTVPAFELPPTMPAPGVVLDLQLDATGTHLAAADVRGEVRITDLRSGDELSLDGHGDRVCGVEWFGDDQLLAVASEDELSIWARAPEDLEPEPWVHGPVDGPSVGPVACDDSSLVAVGGFDGRVLVVDGRRPASASASLRLEDAIGALAWRPGGADLAIGTAAGQLVLTS